MQEVSFRMKKKTKKVIGISSIVLVVLLVIGFLAFTGKLIPSLGEVTQNQQKIYIPLYASTCCEEKGANDWISGTTINSQNNQQTFTCPDTTTQCRVRDPQITCPPSDWLKAPLGYMPLWSIVVKQPNGLEYEYYGNFLGDKRIPSYSPQSFQKGGRLTYQASCLNKALFLGNFWSLFSVAQPPTSNSLDIEYLNTQLVVYPAGEGKYNLPNTNLCNQGTSTTNLKKNEPASNTEKAIMEKASALATSFGFDSNNDNNANKGSVFLKEAPNQLRVGDCYRTVDKWQEYPAFGNINPKGQYQNQDVYCDRSKGLFALELVETYGGTEYLAPTSRLTTPNDFCCADQECTYKGTGFVCEAGTYTCKETTGYCNSDVDCQPEGGIRQDANCYQDAGKFYTLTGAICNTNTHTCSKAVKTTVQCCASYCNAYGKVCDYSYGCKDVIPPKQACPPDACCEENNAFGYYAKSCSGNKECCGVSGGVGACKDVCSVEDDVIGQMCKPTLAFGTWTVIPSFETKEASFFSKLVFGRTDVSCVSKFGWIAFFIALIVLLVMPFVIDKVMRDNGNNNRAVNFILGFAVSFILYLLVLNLFWWGIIIAVVGFIIMRILGR